MFFPDGRTPGFIYVLLFVVSIPWTSTAVAQQRAPLTIAAAEDLALAAEPGERALRARATALEERAAVAGELPDPTLRVGLNNFPVESGGFSTEGMTSVMVGLRQAFPAGHSRAIGSRQFNMLATEMAGKADARGRNVLTAVRNAWLDRYYWERAGELITESRPFFDDLATITRSLYAVGRKSQQDVLRAELELSRLDDRLIEVKRRESAALAALGEWIGQDAMRPLAKNLPGWNQVPDAGDLQQKLLNHPALRAANAQVDARGAGVELAEQRAKPPWAFDLGYSYREGSLPSGQPRSDFITFGVTVSLPFFRKTAVDGTLSAALQERSAARADRERLLREMQSRLASDYARWQELTRRLALYDADILDKAKDNAAASMLAYQSDEGDFAEVMRAYVDDLNTRIDHIRLQVERAKSYAALANLGGLPR